MSHSNEYQKEFKSQTQSENVVSLEISQILVGFIIALLLGLFTGLALETFGFIIIIAFAIIGAISIFVPVLVRFIFLVIGFSLGVVLVYILSVVIGLSLSF